LSGNTLGHVFRITTFGESHGRALGAVIDGCPPGIALCEDDFTHHMERRRPGQRPSDSPRREADHVEILCGVFQGLTTGTPITLLVRNNDPQSSDYDQVKRLVRPGHADLPYVLKYGIYDYRGGGRASARETVARVAAGVVARKAIEPSGVHVSGRTLEIDGVRASRFDPCAPPRNAFSCPDPEAARQMEEHLDACRRKGDSAGGIVEICISGCPAGLGEPVFDKLDADLAKAFMSVGAVKGVEIGEGFTAARLKGSVNNDPIRPQGFASNRAGGILGGLSNGEDITARIAVKPIPSISLPQETVDREGNPAVLRLEGRFDVCAIPRIIPVLEAMAWLVLADHFLRWRAQCGEPGTGGLCSENTANGLHPTGLVAEEEAGVTTEKYSCPGVVRGRQPGLAPELE
jgi:chorismate synthase